MPLTPAVHAATTTNPTITVNDPAYAGGDSNYVDFNFTNPSSNSVAVSTLTITAPTGWTISNCEWESSYLETCTESASSVTWSVGGGIAIPPGGSQEFEFDLTFATGTTYPISAVFSTVWSDNLGTYHTGNSFTLMSFDPAAAITLTPSTLQTFTAGGSAITFTASIGVADAGVPVIFNTFSGLGSFSGATTKIHPSVVIATTNSAGIATVTFAPSNTAGADDVYATIGGGVSCWGVYLSGHYASCDGDYWDSTSTEVDTIPGAPSEVTITIPTAAAASPNDYVILPGTVPGTTTTDATVASSSISVSLADKFSNAVPYASGDALLITANNGVWGTSPTTTATTITASPTSGTSFTIPNAYFQSSIYGTVSSLTASLKRSTITYTGVSAEIITSTFSTASPQPEPTVVASVGAGGTVTVNATLGIAQQNVPVTLYLDTALSTQVNKDGHFAGSGKSVKLFTSSTGLVSTTYSVDTGLGAVQYFLSNVAQPINTLPTNTLGNSTLDSAAITTVAGVASKLIVNVCYLSSAACPTSTATNTVFSSTVYVDVWLADAYGNTAENTGVNQIQIALAPSGGVLSATNVYIPSLFADTYKAFGPIAWTVPGTAENITLSGSGVVNGLPVSGKATLGIVSPLPTISVTSPAPLEGVIYSGTTNPTFIGQANVSIGYPSTVNIASVSYKIDTGSWIATGAGGSNTITWSTAPTLTVGVHTIKFNATDNTAAANVVVSSPYTLLVDVANPTVTFTTATGTTISPGGVVSATVTVAEGDLNFTTVTAKVNGTALPAADIAITGTNNLGSSVTYTVAIAGLPGGSDTVGLSASSLAGLTGTATTITVKASVNIDQTFVSSGSGLPTVTTQSGFSGISTTWTNDGSTSVAAQFWIQFTGPTTSAEFQGSTVAPGGTTTVFFGTAGLAPGSYTATVYVSVGLTPYSPIYTATFTVS